MSRDVLLVREMIDAAERIVGLVGRVDPEQPESDRDLFDALLWNFTVLGEASSQVSTEVKDAHPDVGWFDPIRLRNRIVHGYWSADADILVSTGVTTSRR